MFLKNVGDAAAAKGVKVWHARPPAPRAMLDPDGRLQEMLNTGKLKEALKTKQ